MSERPPLYLVGPPPASPEQPGPAGVNQALRLPAGEWEVVDGSWGPLVCVKDGAVLAGVAGKTVESLNLARLFAASRDLLELAERVAYHFENQHHPIGDAARAVLQRARRGR